MPTETITKTFLSQGAVIVSIVVSTVVASNYMADKNEASINKAFENKCRPLIEDNIILNAFAKENRSLINGHTGDIKNTALSVNVFIDAYNRKHGTEFLRPVDVEELSYKRKK